MTQPTRREEHNIKSRSLGIGFSDLRVTGVTTANSYYDTLGSLLSPKVIMENFQAARHPSLRNILSGFEGVLKPGEMLRASIFKNNVLFLLMERSSRSGKSRIRL